MPVLGVNLDHIATIRQARGTSYPDPVEGALICEECGVHGITLHLREDRRHIQERDVREVQKVLKHCTLNLEMAVWDDVVELAKEIKPYMATIVPEKREERTTEGGLDVKKNFDPLVKLNGEFEKRGILVSLFIEPDRETIRLSKETGARFIEIHTGTYADAADTQSRSIELARILDAAEYAVSLGLRVNAGHGLTCGNTPAILSMKGLEELNIGHSIISRAVIIGLKQAVIEMKTIIEKGAR